MKKQIITSTAILAIAILIGGLVIFLGSSAVEAATAKSTLQGGCRNECIDGYRETSWDDGYYVHPYAYCHVYCPDEAE